jgi:hypothetical protein
MNLRPDEIMLIIASLENTARLMRDDKTLPKQQRVAVMNQCDALVTKFANNISRVLEA